MFRKLLIAVDNSENSRYAMDAGISLAERLSSSLVGMHVYAAQLHCGRFIQLEKWMPEHYKNEDQLLEQRRIHEKLIRDGLQIISQSYLKVFKEKCDARSLPLEKKSVEGKNYVELLREAGSGGYDTVVLGWAGLGDIADGCAGSVCLRVARMAEVDALVVRNHGGLDGGKVMVCMDGSADSFAALKKALALCKAFEVGLDAVAVFDPQFHRDVFKKLANVLSENEKGRFVFRGQEKLHNDIIDNSLSKLYQSQLEKAQELADAEGIKVDTHLLSGKVYRELLTRIELTEPALVVAGKHGLHRTELSEIGSTTENLLRFSTSNLLLTVAG